MLPGDPLALVGFGLIAGTIAVLVFADWPRAYLLGVSAIFLFALQFVDQSFFGAQLGLFELALVPDGVLGGEWWTFATYAFLHGSLFHIIGNLFILLTAGPALEERVGPWWFLGIYAAGALAAAGAGVALAYVDGGTSAIGLPSPRTPMVGASGAIFAVLTAFAVRHPQEKLPIPIIIVVWLPSMVVLLIFLAMNVGFMFVDTGVAWYGHFAGFLAGMAIGMSPIDSLNEAGTKRVDVKELEPLARSDRGLEALERLDELEAGEQDVAEAWLDVFVEEASCPVCDAPLNRSGLALRCPNGHALDDAAHEQGG